MITDMAQEMVSLVEIKRRLAAIEQGQLTAANLLDALHTEQEEISTSQQILCERLDAIAKQQEDDGIVADAWKETLSLWQKSLAKKLDCLQGKELLSQFKANGHKPKRRKKR